MTTPDVPVGRHAQPPEVIAKIVMDHVFCTSLTGHQMKLDAPERIAAAILAAGYRLPPPAAAHPPTTEKEQ